MARIRQIKPEFYLDDELAQCSRDARLLFPGLWMLADRAGRLENRPAKIKAQVFPYDEDLPAEKIRQLLAELEAHRFIMFYGVDGRSYIQIRTFDRHQHCHVNEPPSQIPGPKQDKPSRRVRCKNGASTVQAPDKNDADIGAAPEENGANPATYTSTCTSTSGERHLDNGKAADAAVSGGPEILVEIYKAENKKLPQVLEFGPARRDKCRHRLAKNPGKFIDQFTRAVIKAQQTPFLRGESERGWKADFDWFIANDHNVIKVLEGRYDSGARADPGRTGGTVFDRMRKEREERRNGSDRVA